MNIPFLTPFKQIKFLFYEITLLNNVRWWRWISCWFSRPLWVVASYRVQRLCFLLLGHTWPVIRVLLSPVLFLLHPWFGGCDIHYRADIDKGLKYSIQVLAS